MNQQAGRTYTHTADYSYIDNALRARWEPFMELVKEMDEFVPKVVGDFAAYRKAELVRLQELNPSSSEESLLELIDGQIKANVEPRFQFSIRFSDRVMSEYVTVAFLAHALSEATINAILAIGLASRGTEDVFALLERADIKEKWLVGPKAFYPTYNLSKSSSLYQTLQHLTRQRNAFIHYKIELEMDGEKKLDGSRLDRAPLDTQLTWIKRFFSLPYDLALHAFTQMPGEALLLLHDSGPIKRYLDHKVA
jgi:hypothetical protein